MHKQQGWPQAWEYCQAKPIQTLGRASRGVNWSWSQCIKSHHAQTSSGKELPSHFWNRNIVRSILPGLRRKITLLLISGSKSSFQILHLICKSRSQILEEERRDTESMLLEVQCEVSTVSDHLGCHVICWCWSTVFSEVHSQRSHLPGNVWVLHASDKLYGDADFIFQQDMAPALSAKGTKSWFNNHGVTVLDWPANSPDLNPIENIWGIVKRKMRDTRPNNVDDLKAAIKANCASITPEQCHSLITSMPHRIDAVIHAKGGPTKYWAHRNEHTFKKPDTSV